METQPLHLDKVCGESEMCHLANTMENLVANFDDFCSIEDHSVGYRY
jgi:hypothetical protein